MKPHIPYAFLAMAAACGIALGQAYTIPVGYVTKSLPANQFTLVGVTLHNPTTIAGIVDSVTENTVVDDAVNFEDVLTAGTTYVLELPTGEIQEITSWTGSTLTTNDDLSGAITAGTTSYALRPASTVSDVFGATNSAGLTPSPDGSLDDADKVLILTSAGAFETVFYINDGAGTEGWFDGSLNDASEKPIVYADAFYVQKAATASSLVITGEVKLNPTGGAIVNGWNYIGGVPPVGLTVGTSGLETYLTPSPDGETSSADLLLIQQPDGTYLTVFYVNDGAGTEGWFDGSFNEAGNIPITTGVLIFNRSGIKPYVVDVPESFDDL